MATLMFGASHSLPNPTINDLVTNSDSILAGLGRIVHLEVNLTGLTHAFSDDLDFLFVGPNGANFEFWSDAGGSNAISNGNFTISDSGAFLLPDGTPIASGTYRPSDYLTVENSSNWGLAPGVIINHPTPNAPPPSTQSLMACLWAPPTGASTLKMTRWGMSAPS